VAKITLRGKGPNLPVSALPLALPVIVQLQATHGACWAATYSASGAGANDASRFSGRSD